MSLFTSSSRTNYTYPTFKTLYSTVLTCSCRTPLRHLSQLPLTLQRGSAKARRYAPCTRERSSLLTLLRRALLSRELVVPGVCPGSELAVCIEAARDRGSLSFPHGAIAYPQEAA